MKEPLSAEEVLDNTERCKHPNLPPVPFDEELAKSLNMNAWDVRAKWPRKTQACPDCKEQVICYASQAHYYWGDW